jgi:phytoene dehydrogenase-like protein
MFKVQVFTRNSTIRHLLVPKLNLSTEENLACDPRKLKSKYDVVIIGSGHNGLVAANYLAKFSKKKLKICLLERRNVIGGAAVTEEIIPGFKFSRASYLMSLFRPVIINDLNLMRHGLLKFHYRNPSSYTPLIETDPQYSSSSKSLTLSADHDFNQKQIARFSKKDSLRYGQYEDWLAKICSVLETYMDKPPFNLNQLKSIKGLRPKLAYLKSYLNDLNTAKFFANNYEDIYRLFTEPAAHILNEWFESDVLKASLATDSVIGAMLSPYSEGSAYVLLHHIIGEVEGKKGVWAYVQGGMGSISNCLAINTKEFGDQIEIHLNKSVKKIELAEIDGKPKAKGVLLNDGKFIEANFVLSNCTPKITFIDLLKEYNLRNHAHSDISNFIKRIENINYESGTMKINLAVKKLPNFTADPNLNENQAMPHHQCTIHINCENMDILDKAYKEAKYLNKPSSVPMIEMVIPSSLDPTLAPKGCHVVLLFCQYFPMKRENIDETREKYAQIVFDSIEKYSPGFKNSIIGKDILTPFDLENIFGLTGGNIFHGAMPLSQLYINRPVSGGWSYQTPIDNLLLAGSGAHPGGGVMGSSGRLAALSLLSKIN